MYGVVLKDISKGPEIVKEVKDKYGDDIEIKFNDFNGENAFFIDEFLYTAANGSKLLIYILSFVFA